VTEAQDTSLPHIENALTRLQAAIDRLEGAVTARFASGDLLLAGELRAAREEYQRLEDTTRHVAGRLDGTVERLRLLLES
jgi:hypothetical protein